MREYLGIISKMDFGYTAGSTRHRGVGHSLRLVGSPVPACENLANRLHACPVLVEKLRNLQYGYYSYLAMDSAATAG